MAPTENVAPTQTPTGSPTPTLAPFPVALSEALLTLDDISADDLRGITDYFRPPFSVDDTPPLTSLICTNDCISRTWRGEGDYNVVTMTLLRVDSQAEVRQAIRGFYAGVADRLPGFEYGTTEVARVDGPPENTRIIASEMGPWLWLSTFRENIVILYTLRSHPPPDSFDYNAYDDVSLLTYLANLQLQKISRLGFAAAPSY